MIKLTELLQESSKNELYVVEEKFHTLKINDKPLYSFDFYFFIDKKSAQEKAKELKNKWKNQIGEATVKVYIPSDLFDWVNVNTYRGVIQGVAKKGYILHGGTKMKNPSTGKSIIIDQFLDEEVGQVAKEFFNK